jgi:hypothetical protein
MAARAASGPPLLNPELLLEARVARLEEALLQISRLYHSEHDVYRDIARRALAHEEE